MYNKNRPVAGQCRAGQGGAGQGKARQGKGSMLYKTKQDKDKERSREQKDTRYQPNVVLCSPLAQHCPNVGPVFMGSRRSG